MAEGSSRKILIRVIGAPLLLAALGVLFWIDYVTFDRARPEAQLLCVRGLLTIVGALCLVEFYGLCRLKGIETASVVPVILFVFLLAPWKFMLGILGLPGLAMRVPVQKELVLYGLLLYVLCKLVFRRDRFRLEGASLTVLGFLYVGLLSLVLVSPPKGMNAWYYVLFLLAANKVSDMGAYVVGKAIGRHKMTPVLSPNKTWEGAVGGALLGSTAALMIFLKSPLAAEYHGVPVATLLLFCVSVTIAAQVGDLVESAVKRWAGAKDSGRLIPEFGGFLDMADSFLISAPVAFLLRLWVLEP